MIHFYFGIGFSVLALAAAVFAIRAQPANAPFAPEDKPNPYRLGFFVLVLVIALLAPTTPTVLLKAVIGLAFILLLVGEALMVIPGTPTLVRLGTNAAIYFVFWLVLARLVFVALWQQGSWVQTGISAAAGLVVVALAAFYYLRMRVWFRDVQVSGLIYTINAALVAMLAAMLFAAALSWGSGLLLLGSLCLVAADALLGWSKLRKEIARSTQLHMLLQFAAGLLLAWSAWGMLWGDTLALFA